jgi:P pilus assembly chaperone PapD
VIALAFAAALLAWQVNPPVTPTPAASALPAPSPSASPSAAPTATASPTPPPIVVTPANAQIAVGDTQTLRVGSAMGTITATAAPAGVVDLVVDAAAQTIAVTAKAPGTAVISISDQRGMSASVPVRAAYYAGTVAQSATVRITGDPATSAFVKQEAFRAALALVQLRPGAEIAASPEQISYDVPLAQDNVADVAVPVLLQGERYFTVDSVTHVRVENLAAPKIVPDSLMVSDFPEKLTENGVLFTADLKHAQPSRFLYFHYNPAGEPDRRVVLRVQNMSAEPTLLQFISGSGGPDQNEMAAGHAATYEFMKHLAQNEGRVVVLPGSGTLELAQQELPAKTIASAVLQLRVLNGGTVHMTLFAQDASSSPDEPIADGALLSGDHPHARGIYEIPEFHYSALWRTNDEYLQLPIGQIPLPNTLHGEALSGDYGVLQSFVIKVENPSAAPASVALYEEPRGGRATGTFLIDGVLIQSHQVPPFSRYKIRQYVVPARGFVRVTIETIPDSGSSYPVRLIFAPDDGSVAPGAPGSPIY